MMSLIVDQLRYLKIAVDGEISHDARSNITTLCDVIKSTIVLISYSCLLRYEEPKGCGCGPKTKNDDICSRTKT